MNSAGTLTFRSDYKIGVTNEVTYTCYGKSAFTNVDKFPAVLIAISLPANDSVKTSPAVAGLKRLQIVHNKGTIPSGVKIYTSTDNSTWTDISSSEICSIYDIDVPMPTKGDYYLKVVNKTGAAINLLQFKYICDPCHCLRVVSE